MTVAKDARRPPPAAAPRYAGTARRKQCLALARQLPVDPKALREVVEAISAIGSRADGFRVTGTPEDRETAKLIAGYMRDAGLEAVELEAVTVDGWRLGEARLAVDGRSISGASLGGAPGTPPGGVSGRLVDVATGERRRLDRLEVAGRIVLLDWKSLSVPPADVALEVGSRGAVGVVVASFEGGPLYQAPRAVGGFDSHWHEGAPPVLTVAKEDAAALRARLRDGELVGELTVEAQRFPGCDGTNVLGWLPGTDPGAPIVIGAHHDGWFRGAFDNATGVAAMLALASGLVASGHRPRHTLCFTSRTAEEYGLAPSPFDWCTGAWRQIAERHPEWGAESPFHLCVEASGHPGLRAIVEAPVELAGWARSICRAAEQEGWMTSGWRVGPPVTGTEQWPYLVAGVPGVASYCWETSFRRTMYHTPHDTPALVGFDHLARAVRLDALLLLEADADPDVIHNHASRARRLEKAADELGDAGLPLKAAARTHHRRVGRAPFTTIGRTLHAVDAHGETTYPHSQSASDLANLDKALGALQENRIAAAITALEAVGSNRLSRVLSASAFAAHQARERPGAPRLSWAEASHLTASPDLWAELATLRGEDGSRSSGAWLERSLRQHRDRAADELRRRVGQMAAALQLDPTEDP
jgi:Iap family predicted aminopeptidase